MIRVDVVRFPVDLSRWIDGDRVGLALASGDEVRLWEGLLRHLRRTLTPGWKEPQQRLTHTKGRLPLASTHLLSASSLFSDRARIVRSRMYLARNGVIADDYASHDFKAVTPRSGLVQDDVNEYLCRLYGMSNAPLNGLAIGERQFKVN
jgi:hypothetical protein